MLLEANGRLNGGGPARRCDQCRLVGFGVSGWGWFGVQGLGQLGASC